MADAKATEPTVFVVDDDASVCEDVGSLIRPRLAKANG